VAVSLAEQDALAAWRGESIIVSGVVIGMALMLAIAGLWITRSSRAYARTVEERDRVDAALRESQARLQAIMDHTPLLGLVRDLQGRYTFVNRAAKQWLAAPHPPEGGQTLPGLKSGGGGGE